MSPEGSDRPVSPSSQRTGAAGMPSPHPDRDHPHIEVRKLSHGRVTNPWLRGLSTCHLC